MRQKIRMKKCRICKKEFRQFSSTQTVCSIKCSLIIVREQEQKKQSKELRERKQKLKTKSQWAAEAQTVFNKWVKLRDRNQPCISCQRHHDGQYHAGHYISRGHARHLAFDEDNCHKQCAPCNNHLSGNIAMYRIHLVHKIGIDRVEALENNKEVRKWSVDELKAIKKEYQEKIKILNKMCLHGK